MQSDLRSMRDVVPHDWTERDASRRSHALCLRFNQKLGEAVIRLRLRRGLFSPFPFSDVGGKILAFREVTPLVIRLRLRRVPSSPLSFSGVPGATPAFWDVALSSTSSAPVPIISFS